ncbi:hypothetical protein BGV40_12065 [Methanosarcina sp. Ant1]|nr:hypothetical protein BGV40_12065 [Methanosarcina sp. Ant1]
MQIYRIIQTIIKITELKNEQFNYLMYKGIPIIWRLFNIFWNRQNLPLIPLAIDCNHSKNQKIIKSFII